MRKWFSLRANLYATVAVVCCIGTNSLSGHIDCMDDSSIQNESKLHSVPTAVAAQCWSYCQDQHLDGTNEQASVRSNVCECNLNLACQKFTLTNFSLPRVPFVCAKTAYSLVLLVKQYRSTIGLLLNDSFPVQIGSLRQPVRALLLV